MFISFALGFISGLSLAVLVVALEIYFKPSPVIPEIEKQIQKVAEYIKPAKNEFGAGDILDVPDELEEARQAVIQRNKEAGRPTTLDELQ
jgi:hypothetical protein